jgi:hypothetical protein
VVAHTYSLRYLEGRDREYHNSKLAWAKSLPSPIPTNKVDMVLNEYGLSYGIQACSG